MNNLNEKEKSKGVLIFAFDSSVKYTQIAIQTQKLIKKFLNLPVTIVTDSLVTGFDNNIVVENTSVNYKSAFDSSNWRNFDRFCAYELSPYDETILIDADYLTMSDNLINQLDVTYDYKIMTENKTLTQDWDLTMGAISIPYKWATVIVFKKTEKTKLLFNLAGRIQRNYGYYRKLYNIREGNFRNDYAFTIADYILNGYQTNINTTINTSMITIDNVITNITIKDEFIVIKDTDKGYVIPKVDLHIMDKQYLLTKQFEEFVDLL